MMGIVHDDFPMHTAFAGPLNRLPCVTSLLPDVNSRIYYIHVCISRCILYVMVLSNTISSPKSTFIINNKLVMIVQMTCFLFCINFSCSIFSNNLDVTLVDIDECEQFGTCPQRCFNTVGSFTCKCEVDFEKLIKKNTKLCMAKG